MIVNPAELGRCQRDSGQFAVHRVQQRHGPYAADACEKVAVEHQWKKEDREYQAGGCDHVGGRFGLRQQASDMEGWPGEDELGHEIGYALVGPVERDLFYLGRVRRHEPECPRRRPFAQRGIIQTHHIRRLHWLEAGFPDCGFGQDLLAQQFHCPGRLLGFHAGGQRGEPCTAGGHWQYPRALDELFRQSFFKNGVGPHQQQWIRSRSGRFQIFKERKPEAPGQANVPLATGHTPHADIAGALYVNRCSANCAFRSQFSRLFLRRQVAWARENRLR